MKRLLAVVAAVVMIGVAVVVRSNIDDDGAPSTSGPLTIACVTELEAQCRTLSNVTVLIEEAADTAEKLAAGESDIDGWVTFEPWPEIVDLLAARDAMGDGTRLARSQLVIATVQERQAKLPCDPNWRCIGNAIGQPWEALGGDAGWGNVKVGLPPLTSGSGLLVYGNAVSGFVGKADIATNDLEADPEFPVWEAKMMASMTSDPLRTFALQFPAAFSFVGTTEAERNAVTRAGVGTMVPTPTASAVVVSAPVSGRRVSGITVELKEQLVAAGWSADGLNEPTGLPDAGVLLSLSGLTG